MFAYRKIIIGIYLIVFNSYSDNKNLSLMNTKNLYDGSLTLNFLLYLKNIFDCSTFVETGTFKGSTTFNASTIFNQVHSIELSNSLYNETSQRLNGISNIKLYLGDSGEQLKTILKSLQDKKILFWLDAHYSTGPTALGNSTSAILSELKCIKESGLTNSVILIDDLRLFDKCMTVPDHPIVGCYPTLEEIVKVIYEINSDYNIIVYGDILCIFPNNNIIISRFLKSCSLSRLYNITNFDLSNVLRAEKIIADTINTEKDALNELRLWSNGKYYIYWHAIELLYKKHYQLAYNLLIELQQKDFCKFRMKTYLDKCISYLNGH